MHFTSTANNFAQDNVTQVHNNDRVVVLGGTYLSWIMHWANYFDVITMIMDTFSTIRRHQIMKKTEKTHKVTDLKKPCLECAQMSGNMLIIL